MKLRGHALKSALVSAMFHFGKKLAEFLSYPIEDFTLLPNEGLS